MHALGSGQPWKRFLLNPHHTCIPSFLSVLFLSPNTLFLSSSKTLFLFCFFFFFTFYFPYKQTPFFLCGFSQQFSWNLDIGMAGNEWINGYLEAILVSGASAIEDSKATPIALREGGHFNPTKYFVEEVVTGVDETDLHRTWIKVVATRNTRERSSRLENMCWRIWHLARKKKQVLVFLDSFSLFLLIYIGVCWFSCVQALF